MSASSPPTQPPDAADLALTQALAAYIPEMLVNELALLAVVHSASLPIALARQIQSVTMIVDITGFTPLCEALARTGREGAERVTELINSFFSQALQPVRDLGGVVTKFGGDAFQAFFERRGDEPWADVALRALHSAWALQTVVSNYAAVRVAAPASGEQHFILAAKVGLSAGPLVLFSVGDPALHCDVQVAGPAANQAAEAEHQATPGDIIAHRELIEHCRTLPGIILGEQRGAGWLVAAVTGQPPAAPPPHGTLDGLSPAARAYFAQHAAAFIPRRIYDRLRLGYPALPGEHRRVISLFVQFAGFDWLGDSQAAPAFQAFYLAVLRIVQDFNGNLNRISSGDKGDVLHILFGAPVSQQDDEAQAMRCALALQLCARQHPLVQTQQIGMSSGFVFAGDIGGTQRHEYTVIGDSVNLAARLMQRAQPWTILVDLATAQRVHTLFAFANVHQVMLKGKQDALTVCELTGSGIPALPPIASSASATLFGREPELARITAVLAEALAGRGQVLAIHGEPGIGKSRLLDQVASHWQQLGGRRCQTAAANYERGAFQIWNRWLSELFGLVASDSPADRAAQFLDQFQILLPELADWAPLWAELLNLDLGDSPLIRALDRPTRRQRLADLTPRLLRAWADRQPLLLALDDAHWADHASLELLEQIIPALEAAPVALCFGYRSAEAPAWQEQRRPTWHEMALAPLTPAATEHLILNTIDGAALTAEQQQRLLAVINELTGGNPFFIEELINMLRSSPLLERILRGDTPGDLLSYNIQSLVMGRLDSLDDQLREVVLAAAVVGGQISAAMIAPLVPPAVAIALNTASSSPLDTLVGLDLLRPEEQAGQPSLAAAPTYRFRHALLQQVAYESLPFARRRTLHEAVGEFLAANASPAEEDLGRLAFHFERSTNDLQAVRYLTRNAARAARLFANNEAIQQYQTALERAGRAAAAQPQPAEILRELGDVQAQIADFAAALGSYAQALAGVPASEHFERARLLRRRAEVLVRANRFDEALAEIGRTEGELDQLETRQRAGASRNQIKLARAQIAELHSTILVRQSQYGPARAWAQKGIDLLQRAGNLAEQAGAAKVRLYQALAQSEAALQHMEPAQQAISQALKLLQRQPDPVMEGQLRLRMAILAMQRDELRKAPIFFQQALPMIERTGAKDRLAYVLLPGGHTLLYRGEYAQARRWLERGLILAREVGTAYLICSGVALLAWTDWVTGHWDQALAGFDESIELARRHSLWDRLTEALCRKSEILLARGDYQRAQAQLTEALGYAETYKLEILLSMVRRITARLHYSQGFFGQAATELRTISQASEDTDLIIAEHWALQRIAQPDAAVTAFDPAEPIARNAQTALSFFQTHGFKIFAPAAWRINGLVAWAQGDHAEAIRRFTAGLRLARATQHGPEIARLTFYRGLCGQRTPNRHAYLATADLKQAAAHFKRLKAQPETHLRADLARELPAPA